MRQRSVKLLTDQNAFSGFKPFLSRTPNCLSLFIVRTGGHQNVSGVGARPLCPFPFQSDPPQSRWPFTPLIVGFCLWSSEGTKVTIPVELYIPLRFNVTVKRPQRCMDLRELFLKLELPAGFMFLIVFLIFVLFVLLAPSLNLLSPVVGVSKMQCGKPVQCTNKFGHI